VKPTFFKTRAHFRTWLARHHASATELYVGFYRKGSERVAMTYDEALEEALCFGWIDGVRRRVDEWSYTNRFSPRTARSHWSAVNIRRARALIDDGRMDPAGLRVFEARDPRRCERYSYERASALSPALQRTLRANRAAWAFFSSQPPFYRRMMAWYVASAKKDETRAKRMQTLIAASAAGRRL
jgi:uncharacterized protein YdeI (YjbR/CyaY-like superfamily)